MSKSLLPKSLRADDISVTFAGLRALKNVTVELTRGRVLGLIGPNGAGKTTLVNVLTGFSGLDSGQVLLDGASSKDKRADQFRRGGVARTFRGRRLFQELTVQDNLEVTGVGLGMSRREAGTESQRILQWMGLQALADQMAGSLPYTDERRVGIARAIVGKPSFLPLDEPAAGMSEYEAEDLRSIIGRIVREIGCGVLLIEHIVRLVLSICSHTAGCAVEVINLPSRRPSRWRACEG
jgi:branched-chain amino acid transport system ATP-binding protein